MKMPLLDRLLALSVSMPQRWTRMQRLRRAVSSADARRIVARSTRDRSTLTVRLTALGRPLTIRANTSDVACLEKIFVDEEYRLPIEANPAFDLKPRLIVDGGANIGLSTLFFAHSFPAARIVAIEPEAANFALLSENCRDLPNVTLKKAALWPSNVPLQLVSDHVDPWSFSVRPADQDAATLDAVTIPRLLAELGADWIDVLKLDIEGAERELFDDSCTAWLPRVGLIIIELHDRMAPGCAERFYSRLMGTGFVQEVRGENIFVLVHAPR